MIKKIITVLFFALFTYTASAETIAYKLKGNLNIEGSSSIEVNATPLIDKKVIENSKDKLITIINTILDNKIKL